ncbi:hypothetical protein OB919_21495 [Halobacteria archaeon AArc-curdl1]|uniref:Uncharacterized protein n=1 Tax=Natronosalvus hydrolyticus TaxID=2979988 RepID=A0AAP3E908_9EURY|nr:hypothetical protein [Halobacteria archaeon AArc-curdl1]
MDDAREYCIRPESDEAFALSLLGENQVHALGFDEDSEQWVQFYSTDMEFSEEAFQEFEDAIYGWVKARYESRLDDGELKMSGPSDPVLEDGEKEVPPEVEMGLEPEYDCPDCGYYKTGVTTSPHGFLDHLREVHDYSDSEAHEILNG